jgi:hypothetical protein
MIDLCMENFTLGPMKGTGKYRNNQILSGGLWSAPRQVNSVVRQQDNLSKGLCNPEHPLGRHPFNIITEEIYD